jgi:hypothetical protein
MNMYILYIIVIFSQKNQTYIWLSKYIPELDIRFKPLVDKYFQKLKLLNK